MPGVLGNFLGTYMSRYADFNGYWLFGLLLPVDEELRFDLLAPDLRVWDTPREAAASLASLRFGEQVEKAGLSLAQVRQAAVVITRREGTATGWVNDHQSLGFILAFRASATVENDRSYASERTVFVAPHDPTRERRNTRQHSNGAPES